MTNKYRNGRNKRSKRSLKRIITYTHLHTYRYFSKDNIRELSSYIEI